MAVKLDPEALESAAAQVSSIGGNFSAELSSLGGLVASSKEYWDDPVQAAFEAKFNEFKVTMERFIEALNQYSTQMKTHAENTRETTNVGVRMFNI